MIGVERESEGGVSEWSVGRFRRKMKGGVLEVCVWVWLNVVLRFWSTDVGLEKFDL